MRSASSSTTTTQYGSRSSGRDGLVVALDVPHLLGLEQLVALVHLADDPAQAGRRLLGVGDHRRQQVRDALVDDELEALGIDHQEAHVGRRGLVEDRADHRVEPDRLAAAGGAGHEQVRHRREIGHDRRAGHVLAEGQRAACPSTPRTPPTRRSRAGRRSPPRRSGTSTATVPRPGNRPHDPDRRRLQGERQIVGEVHDLADLDAGRRLELVGGDDRARAHLDDAAVDLEVLELAAEGLGVVLQLLARALRAPRAAATLSSPTGGSWNASAPPLPKSKVSCQARPCSMSPPRGREGSTTTGRRRRRPGIEGAGRARPGAVWLEHRRRVTRGATLRLRRRMRASTRREDADRARRTTPGSRGAAPSGPRPAAPATVPHCPSVERSPYVRAQPTSPP